MDFPATKTALFSAFEAEPPTTIRKIGDVQARITNVPV